MTAILKLEILAGASIYDASATACRVSGRLGVGVEFSFNGVRCLVWPYGHDQRALVEAWRSELERPMRQGPDSLFCCTGEWR